MITTSIDQFHEIQFINLKAPFYLHLFILDVVRRTAQCLSFSSHYFPNIQPT